MFTGMMKKIARKIKPKKKKKVKRIILPYDPIEERLQRMDLEKEMHTIELPDGRTIRARQVLQLGKHFIRYIDEEGRERVEEWREEKEPPGEPLYQ